MIPVKFPEAEATYGKNSAPYVPIHVFVDDEEVISCWRLSWWERAVLLCTGRLWLRQYTRGTRMRPQYPQVEVPFIRGKA